MKTIYLCGPINGCSDAEATDWREAAKIALVGFATLDPMRRDYRGRELEPGVAEEIVLGDYADLEASDVILAVHPKPSTGTDMEIHHMAICLKRPVVTVVPEGAPISPWLKYHSTVIVQTLAAAAAWISENAR